MSSTRSNARHEPSKLPAFLIEPYQRYKRNTDKLASWLGRSAESLGYSQLTKPTPAAAQPNPKSVRRRKGKVRAPQAADQVPSSASGSNPQSQCAADGSRPPNAVTTYFSTADFVTLAEFIASSSNPSANVPPRVLDWAKRAIFARRQCGEWFQLNTRPGSAAAAARVGVRDDGNLMERSNKSHAHFIAILEEVVCILEKRVCRQTVRGALAKVDSVLELNAGRYSPLADDSAHASTRDDTAEEELEDDWDVVNEEGLAAFTHTHTTRAHKSRAPKPIFNTSSTARRIYRIQDDDPMAFIDAYSTHLSDMLHVTRFVTHMWNDHLVYNLPSQQVAGLATTAAVDKIQAEHAEICVAYPDYMANEFAYSDLLFFMTVFQAQRTDVLRAKTFQGDRIEDYQSAIREPAVERAMFIMTSATCLGEQVVAASLRRAFKRSDFKDCAFGPADVADPPHIADASQEVAAWMTTNMEELVRDMEALRCLYYAWQEVEHMLASAKAHIAILDTLDTIFTTSDPIPLPKLFALRVYLCLDRMARRRTKDLVFGRVMVDFFDPMNVLSNGFSACLSIDQSLPSTVYNKILARFIHPAPWLQDTGLVNCQKLLPLHPWAAGMLSGGAYALARKYACEMEDRAQYIHLGAFVYVAVSLCMRDLGLNLGKDCYADGSGGGWWPRMDKFFELVGGKHKVFVGRDPTEMVDVWKAFSHRLGLSSASLALNVSPPAGRAKSVRYVKFRQQDWSLWRLVDETISPVCYAVLKPFADAGTHPIKVGAMHQMLSKCTVDVDFPDASRKSTKKRQQPLNSLPLPEYLKRIKDELIANESAISHLLLTLRAQALLLLRVVDTTLAPHVFRLLPKYPDPQFDDPHFRAVATLITALVPLHGQNPAANAARLFTGPRVDWIERRRLVKEIVVKIHECACGFDSDAKVIITSAAAAAAAVS